MSSVEMCKTLNASIVKCLWGSKPAVWWTRTKWLSYCNSHQGRGCLNTKYDMKGRELHLSHCAHQRADRRMTPSFPLILKESRMGTRGWQCSLNRSVSPPEWFSPFLSHSHTLIFSICDFIFPLIDCFFFPSVSQLAEKFWPFRVSIDVMSPNRSASWYPWNLERSQYRCLHTYRSILRE